MASLSKIEEQARDHCRYCHFGLVRHARRRRASLPAHEGAGQPGPLADLVPTGRRRELEELLGIVQPTLSQQLTVLRDEELVSTRREGKNIYYALTSPQALAVMQVLYAQFCQPAPAPKQRHSN